MSDVNSILDEIINLTEVDQNELMKQDTRLFKRPIPNRTLYIYTDVPTNENKVVVEALKTLQENYLNLIQGNPNNENLKTKKDLIPLNCMDFSFYNNTNIVLHILSTIDRFISDRDCSIYCNSHHKLMQLEKSAIFAFSDIVKSRVTNLETSEIIYSLTAETEHRVYWSSLVAEFFDEFRREYFKINRREPVLIIPVDIYFHNEMKEDIISAINLLQNHNVIYLVIGQKSETD